MFTDWVLNYTLIAYSLSQLWRVCASEDTSGPCVYPHGYYMIAPLFILVFWRKGEMRAPHGWPCSIALKGAGFQMANCSSNPSRKSLKNTSVMCACMAKILMGWKNGGKGIAAGPNPTESAFSHSLSHASTYARWSFYFFQSFTKVGTFVPCLEILVTVFWVDWEMRHPDRMGVQMHRGPPTDYIWLSAGCIHGTGQKRG